MYKYLFTLLLMCFAGLVSAQGWERVYGGSGQDDLSGVTTTPDGGFVMTGYYNSESQIYLIKADANGDLQFSKKFPVNVKSAGRAIVATQDGGYAIAGYTQLPVGSQRDFCLLKTDAFGNLLWVKNYGLTNANEEANDLIELADGSLVLAGFRKQMGEEDLMVIKTDPNGAQTGINIIGDLNSREIGNSVALAPNGDVVITGEYRQSAGSNSDVLVVRLNASITGQVWKQTYDVVAQVDDIAYAAVMANDGNIVVAGYSYGNGLVMKIPGDGAPAPIWFNTSADSTRFYGLDKDPADGYYACGAKEISAAQTDLNIRHFDAQGANLWSRTVGRAGLDYGKSAVTTRDGGVAAAGISEPFLDVIGGGQPDGYLVKADGNGVVFTSYLHGNVFRDFNGNCSLDNGEPELRDWIIKASSPNLTRYTISREDGSFQIAVDTGTYAVTIISPNDYWKACTGTIIAPVPSFGDTITVNIPVRSEFDCPRNEVDIATPLLQRCAENMYTVRYCNSGTVPSINTEIIVHLDHFLTLSSSSILAEPVGGNDYKFNIGTLSNGDCGDFRFTAFLSCDSTVTGQTFCASAHIYPDTFCNTGAWNGAFVQARGVCDGDTVRLFLKNKGFVDPTTPIGYVIAEDVVMLTAPNDPNNQVLLVGTAEKEVFKHEVNGKTYRIIADQEPTYPGLSRPTAAVEGCVNDTSSAPISLGFYTMFPEDDADAFLSTDCQESSPTSYNPQLLKRGHPKGYDVAHYVSPETDLDFLIRFTNTGVDTVQQITIRDTLSAALDPTTVHPGAASHPYQLDIYGNGIVQFTFTNVNLAPDSSANEGFVRFRVSQKPNLDLCGTTIFNSAAIYFDYNAPEMTNETFHTVCAFDTFVIVKTVEYFNPKASLKVYPNPMTDGATFEVTGLDAHIYRLELYDMQGRTISRESFNQPTFQLFRHQLPAGLILYRLTADGQPVAAGKLLVQSRE